MTPHSSKQPPSVEAHEGAWIYVSGPMQVAEPSRAVDFYNRLADAVQSSGWHVYRPYQDTLDPPSDDRVPLFHRLRHALHHADACVLYVGRPSSGVGAELAFAHAHARPVIAVSLDDDEPSPFVASLLATYSRARTVTGTDPQACADAVGLVLADPAFAEIVREAATEVT
jgi:hypothetical protein